MAKIKPVSDLREKIGESIDLAEDTKEPVYLTENGMKRLVLIDADAFDVIVG